ncbi:glycerol kinase [Limosa lapponica baueri]|uniref:Glycerol kinase n=1 Tax=Limosa lapponica baueri TaxID=1758121 RepID=A0A2I0TDW0_LIMLA|nr:glycerol kinase [Limosa lapponica baueri]
MASRHPCSSPELPAPSFKGYKLSFLPEFQPKLSVQPGQSSSLLARLSARGDGLLLQLKDFLLEDCLALLDSVVLQDCLPKYFVNQALKQAKVCPPEVQVWDHLASIEDMATHVSVIYRPYENVLYSSIACKEPMRKGAVLDLILTNKEGLVGNVKHKDSLGRSDHEMIEFTILRAVKRVCSKFTTLDFRRADFGLLWDLIGRVTWEKVLEGRGAQGSWLVFKDHLLQAQEKCIAKK